MAMRKSTLGETPEGKIIATRDGVSWLFWVEIDGDSDRFMVFNADVPEPNRFWSWYDWAKKDAAKIARTYDVSSSELIELGESTEVGDRVQAMEMISGYFGPENLDAYPREVGLSELRRIFKGHQNLPR